MERQPLGCRWLSSLCPRTFSRCFCNLNSPLGDFRHSFWTRYSHAVFGLIGAIGFLCLLHPGPGHYVSVVHHVAGAIPNSNKWIRVKKWRRQPRPLNGEFWVKKWAVSQLRISQKCYLIIPSENEKSNKVWHNISGKKVPFRKNTI